MRGVLVLGSSNGRVARTRISGTPWKINACPITYFSFNATSTGYLPAWPTKGDIYFARIDKNGAVVSPGEIKTSGRSGMRSGVVALGAPNGTTLVAWKHDEELGWQIYDRDGHPEDVARSVSSRSKGAAGVVNSSGEFHPVPVN